MMRSEAKKIVVEMAILVALAVAVGLGRNYFLREPLPLFRYESRAATAARAVTAPFQEADAELVLQLAGTPQATIVDARHRILYEDGHLPSALSLPLADFAAAYPGLAQRLAAAPMLIVYCSGRDCHDSLLLIQKLYDAGLKSLFLYRGGMEEWLEKGYAIEK